MIAFIFALGVGYALGTFIPKDSSPYLWCPIISGLLYVATNAVLTAFSPAGISFPALLPLVGWTLVLTPLLLLGVFLAQRKASRSGY